MAGISDLPNEIILMIWHVVPIDDVYSFSTVSKNIYQLSRRLLPVHHRLKRDFSMVSNKDKGGGVFAQTLKEVLKNPRAALYPSVLEVESWLLKWTKPHLGALDRDYDLKVSEGDLDLFEKVIRSTNIIEQDNHEDWVEELRSGNEEPLIALLLMHLPNLVHISWKGVVGANVYTSEMLNAIAMKSKCFSLHKLADVAITHMAEESDLPYADIDLLRSFANIPSVEHIEGDGIASSAGDIELEPPPFSCISNATSLSFVNSNIDPKSMSELLFTTHKLEDFYYAADDPNVGQNFDAFWIRTALIHNARNTLKSLTLLAHDHAHSYMGSLEELPFLEFLETNLRLLIGDPAHSVHMPSTVLPNSIKEVTLHVNHLADAPYYISIVRTTSSCLQYYPHLSKFTLEGIPPDGMDIPSSEAMDFEHVNSTFSSKPKSREGTDYGSNTAPDEG